MMDVILLKVIWDVTDSEHDFRQLIVNSVVRERIERLENYGGESKYKNDIGGESSLKIKHGDLYLTEYMDDEPIREMVAYGVWNEDIKKAYYTFEKNKWGR